MLRGECTPEELEQLEQYWNQQEKPEVENLLNQYWEDAGKESAIVKPEQKKRIWKQLKLKSFPTKVISLRQRSIRWAVAASIAAVFVWGALKLTLTTPQTQLIVVTNTDQAPKEIKLEDGSVVWLKQQGALTYSQPFEGDTRTTSLSGEAFFEIARDTTKPFIVESDFLQVKVLGTAFNVNNKDEDMVKVALVEGSVAVQMASTQDTTVFLEPGEQFVYNNENKQFNTEKFEKDQPYAWKEGIIVFDKAYVSQVAKILEDWYGIKVSIEKADLIQDRLMSRFDTKKLTVSEVIEGINTTMKDEYVIEKTGKDTYVIKPI